MASTLLNESGLWHPDAIERSLAHGERNGVRAAYHRGAHWDERVRMAQWWSDHLDDLRATGKILRPKFRKESGEPRRGTEKKVGRAKSAAR
jgi:DNA topoisomerase VI subunit A